jgi:hypothetical protein
MLVLAEGCFYRLVNLSDSFAASNMGRLWFWRNVRENNWGHRDNVDYTLQPAPGKRRIVFLGDSFTFGHGIADVEDRFANRLRRRLEEAAPGQFEVYALSFPGWSTRAELSFLRPLAERGFRADLVVLAYVLNDHIDIGELAEQDRQQRAAMASLRPNTLLLRKSYLANFLYYRFAVMRLPVVRNYYDWALGGYESPFWDAHQRDLLFLRAYCKQFGARLAVVTFPFLHDLGPDYAFAGVHAKLDAFWRQQGVPHLDLMATFRPYEPSELTVNRFDAHPNEYAHGLAADAIYVNLLKPELERRDLPQKEPTREQPAEPKDKNPTR